MEMKYLFGNYNLVPVQEQLFADFPTQACDWNSLPLRYRMGKGRGRLDLTCLRILQFSIWNTSTEMRGFWRTSNSEVGEKGLCSLLRT